MIQCALLELQDFIWIKKMNNFIKHTFLTGIFIVVICLMTTACDPSEYTHPPTFYGRAWPMQATKHGQSITLVYQPSQNHLTPAQKRILTKAQEELMLHTPFHADIWVTSHSRHTTRLTNLCHFLKKLGISSRNIKTMSKSHSTVDSATIKVMIYQFEARLPRCPGWTEPMTASLGHYNVGPEGEKHFGCSSAHNLARMIHDPKDLVEPMALGYGDGAYLAKTVTSAQSGDFTPNDNQKKDSKASIGTAFGSGTSINTTGQ